MIKLIIVDDHPLMIDGIKTAISDTPDISIIGEANNGKQLLEILTKTLPDVILLDIRMPELDGIDALKIIKEKYKEVKVIMLSQFGERGLIKKSLEFGASGYLLKCSDKQILLSAIYTVFNGGTSFEIHAFNTQNSTKTLELSQREKEVLNLIMDEYETKKIANKLKVSISTVNTYRSRLMQKAGVNNDIGLYKWAIENKFYK